MQDYSGNIYLCCCLSALSRDGISLVLPVVVPHMQDNLVQKDISDGKRETQCVLISVTQTIGVIRGPGQRRSIQRHGDLDPVETKSL